MMKSKRDELQSANERFKDSLESQLNDLKRNFDKIGKNALIVGGGLIGAYLLSTAFVSKGDKKNKKKRKSEKSEKKETFTTKENLLTATLKEQAIVFLLGLAAERLTTFLKEIDSDTDEKE